MIVKAVATPGIIDKEFGFAVREKSGEPGPKMVYGALATILELKPAALAMALTVSVAATEMGAVYACVEPPAVVAGCVPSRV